MVDFAASFSAEQKILRRIYTLCEMLNLFAEVSTLDLKAGQFAFVKFNVVCMPLNAIDILLVS